MTNKTLNFLFKINDLQKTKRYGNYPEFIESTSEHTFKLILLIDYFYKELKSKIKKRYIEWGFEWKKEYENIF